MFARRAKAKWPRARAQQRREIREVKNAMAASTTTGNFKVIGTRPIRHDGVDKVTGRARYGADYSFPGMLHGKVLRSPFAHARIISINVEQAIALPGVKAIVTGAELPELPNRMEALGEI